MRFSHTGRIACDRRATLLDGHSLDLTYVQHNLIAMSFPAVGLASMYRNPAAAVLKYLDSRHSGHYKVYNLCAEGKYAPARFGGQVLDLPCEDHQAPPLALLERFCADAAAHLAADPQNVAVVHCRAGKGRTGAFVCALLLHLEVCCDVDSALALYTAKRMLVGTGVSIPSQQRFLRYYADVLRAGSGLPRPRTLTLAALSLRGLPARAACRVSVALRTEGGSASHPSGAAAALRPAGGAGLSGAASLAPEDAAHVAVVASVRAVADGGGAAAVPLRPCAVAGDVKVTVQQEAFGRLWPLFYAWVSTAFLAGGDMVLPRGDLDKVKTARHLATELRMSFVEGGGDGA